METDKNAIIKEIQRISNIVVKVLLAIFFLLLLLSFFKIIIDCQEKRARREIVKRTGYIQENENWEVIPDTIVPYKVEELDSLPKSVSLEAFFPPIGNQEAYGTCVAWAIGYNLTTALKAIKYHWTPDQLADPANQVSPKDLWFGIENSAKVTPCDGTYYEPTFYVMMTTGAASMDKMPYESMGGNCNGVYYGDTANVLRYYKHVVSSNGGLPNIDEIKAYINDTIPLVVSTHVGDRFMTWDSDAILDYDTYLLPGQKHAGHALVISGYDDGRNAFRIRNTWGADWGDEGSIWVDYDFFLNQFCKAVFMAEK